MPRWRPRVGMRPFSRFRCFSAHVLADKRSATDGSGIASRVATRAWSAGTGILAGDSVDSPSSLYPRRRPHALPVRRVGLVVGARLADADGAAGERAALGRPGGQGED